LLSDLCPASGDGFAGHVDADVCFDDAGLPYIPGKRLKGCLRECGLDIVSVDESYGGVFDALFGEINGIETLLKKRGYDYKAYQTFLISAAQRIKQKRRSKDEKDREGGDNNAK
jgi:CRISPR-associated protein Csx10